jgi:nicotinate-nucleotide adenylyltransferase
VKDFELDQLLVIPAFKPPHKNLAAISGSLQRYEMCVLAFADEPRITVSKMEIELPERPFTIDTIERLRAKYGNQAELFFVMGADSFAEITTWRDYQKLLASTNIIVATRPGVSISTDHLPDACRARVIDARGENDIAALIKNDEGCFIYLTDSVTCDISSTEIRRRVRQGLSLQGLTESRVIDYLEEHQLYKEVQAKT